jgi:peptide/nickel transport system permease protein
MFMYILRRLIIMIPTLILISIVSFAALVLPPGDYLTSYAAGLRTMGEQVDEEALESLRERYGLGQPVYVQYFKWVKGIVAATGAVAEWQRPVKI